MSLCILSRAAVVLLFFALVRVASASEPVSPHVCVIGAGIAGSTAAFFLSRSPSTSISVFEKQARVGGRMQVLTLPNTPQVEAGASIIASENQLMSYFTNLLNLTRIKTSPGTMGLWNGTAFVFRTRPSSPQTLFWLMRKYGFSVPATNKYVRALLQKYKKLYPKHGVGAVWHPHPTVESLLRQADNLFNLTQVSFLTEAQNVFNNLYIQHMIGAITRVNYGQDVHEMNAMSGAVALAGSGQDLWAVKEGNYKVVERLLERSAAKVHLQANIKRVDVQSNHYTLSDGNRQWHCNAVILAAPLELMSLELPQRIAKRTHTNRKFQLTVTTFVRGNLNEATFGPKPPTSIFTTNLVNDSFTSISISRASTANQKPLFKVFSRMNLADHHITRIFEQGSEIVATYPWMAYPKFSPPEKFTPFDLDDNGVFIYTSPLESAGSAMEMSAVSGANAAALVREKLGLLTTPDVDIETKEDL